MERINISDIMKNRERVGSILRGIRTMNEVTQRDIAVSLGYVNINFISMIETGRSSPPLGKLVELKNAYKFEPEIILIILRYLYPEIWDAMIGAMASCTDIFNADLDGIEKKVETKFREFIKDYSMVA